MCSATRKGLGDQTWLLFEGFLIIYRATELPCSFPSDSDLKSSHSHSLPKRIPVSCLSSSPPMSPNREGKDQGSTTDNHQPRVELWEDGNRRSGQGILRHFPQSLCFPSLPSRHRGADGWESLSFSILVDLFIILPRRSASAFYVICCFCQYIARPPSFCWLFYSLCEPITFSGLVRHSVYEMGGLSFAYLIWL